MTLTLTVPRRHILAALTTVSREPGRPILNHVAFQASRGEEEGGDGKLLTIATNGHVLVAMTGGGFEGDWPDEGRELLVHSSQLPTRKTRALLDEAVTVVLDGENVEIKDRAANFYGQHARNPYDRYPDWRAMRDSFADFVPVVAPVSLDVRVLQPALDAIRIFNDHARKRGSFEFLYEGEIDDKHPPKLCRVRSSTWEDRQAFVLVMGLRDVDG